MGSHQLLCRVVLFAVIGVVMVVAQDLTAGEIARRQSQLTMDTFRYIQEQFDLYIYPLEDTIAALEARVVDLEARESPAVPGGGETRPSKPDKPSQPDKPDMTDEPEDSGQDPGHQEPGPEPEPEPEPDTPTTEKPRKPGKPVVMTTTMEATTVEMVRLPTTQPGPIYDRTCAEIFNHGYIYSGEYTIDPDGHGPISPFTVHCDMENGEGITQVGHSDEQENIQVNGYENPGSFNLQPIYNNGASLEQLGALADASKSCRQYVKYACKNSGLMEVHANSGLTYAWWVDRNGQKRVNFGGAPTDSEKCACFYGGPNGDENTCFMGSETCNCDHKKAKNQVDDGEFTDKDLLPVKSINLGDTGSKKEKGAVTLGKFICEG